MTAQNKHEISSRFCFLFWFAADFAMPFSRLLRTDTGERGDGAKKMKKSWKQNTSSSVGYGFRPQLPTQKRSVRNFWFLCSPSDRLGSNRAANRLLNTHINRTHRCRRVVSRTSAPRTDTAHCLIAQSVMHSCQLFPLYLALLCPVFLFQQTTKFELNNRCTVPLLVGGPKCA